MSGRDGPTNLKDDLRVIPEIDPVIIDTADSASTTGRQGVRVGRSSRVHYRLIAAALVLIDTLCLAAALLAAHAVRFGTAPNGRYMTGILAAAFPWVAVFFLQGLYAPQFLSGLEEFRRTVSSVAVGIVVVILLSFWFDVYLSRSWMALTLVIALALELIARRIVGLYIERLRGRQSLVIRALVIGDGELASDLTKTLAQPGSGFRPLGSLGTTNLLVVPDGHSDVDHVARLRDVLRAYKPDCVFVASSTIGNEQMILVMRAARLEGVTVRIYTHLSGILASRVSVQPIGKDGIALTLKTATLSASQRVVKRTMDIALAGAGLIVTFPLMLLAACAVKATSRGPVFYCQNRVTERRKTFRMYKFRTMTNDADHYVQERSIDTSLPFFKLQRDPRLTKVGRQLRNLSIDELPQLLNVLLGDMSLVGPRPLPAEQVSANLELLGPRHEVRAGMTGWWQIQGRANLDANEAIRLDHFYIENWSPALDLYILLRTIGVVMRGKGAR